MPTSVKDNGPMLGVKATNWIFYTILNSSIVDLVFGLKNVPMNSIIATDYNRMEHIYLHICIVMGYWLSYNVTGCHFIDITSCNWWQWLYIVGNYWIKKITIVWYQWNLLILWFVTKSTRFKLKILWWWFGYYIEWHFI